MGRQPARLRAARLQGRRRPPGGRAKRSMHRANRARQDRRCGCAPFRMAVASRTRKGANNRRNASSCNCSCTRAPDRICRCLPAVRDKPRRCAPRAVCRIPCGPGRRPDISRRAATRKRARRRAFAPSGRWRQPASQSNRGEAPEPVLAARGRGYGIAVSHFSSPSRHGRLHRTLMCSADMFLGPSFPVPRPACSRRTSSSIG